MSSMKQIANPDAFQPIVTAINNAFNANNRKEATRLLEGIKNLLLIMKHDLFGQRFICRSYHRCCWRIQRLKALIGISVTEG
mmetsp:Transcript_13211/g.16077  ORF Transcript_13211/g.16077 Transcript_13211/m.16077 type:complete len:82 (+) Transcript_13211:200-445(+)